jgi:hypothetical protein
MNQERCFQEVTILDRVFHVLVLPGVVTSEKFVAAHTEQTLNLLLEIGTRLLTRKIGDPFRCVSVFRFD